MQDTEFFTKLLEIKDPWRVVAVQMDLGAQRIEVTVECQKTLWADPATRERVTIHGYEARSWRDMDIRQMETVIHARVPRLRYPDGHTELLPVPWAEARSRFTTFFESWAVQVMLAAQSLSSSLLGCCKWTGVPRSASWSAPSRVGWPGGVWKGCGRSVWMRRASCKARAMSRPSPISRGAACWRW